MEPMDTALRLEALLEHADWVRRLARSLVADPARAEDVAQETWLAALRSPPAETGHLRAWLGAVVRNAARRSGRSEERRGRREAAAARDEALPSAAELVEQADLQRGIAALVIALEEPYRGTLLLRYYQGLGPAEIAARTGVPLNTVRTRLARGLEQLRERLDRRFESRGAWLTALAPLAATHAPGVLAGSAVVSSGTALGAVLMSAKVKWAFVAVAACLGLGWWVSRDEFATPEREVAARVAGALDVLVTPPPPVASASDERVAQAGSPAAPEASSPPPRVTTVIRGRCVDLQGIPRAGLELEWVDEHEARLADGSLFAGPVQIPLTPELLALANDAAGLAAAHPELSGARGVAEALRGEPLQRPRVWTAADGTFEISQDVSAVPRELGLDPALLAGVAGLLTRGGDVALVRRDLVLLARVRVDEVPEPLFIIAETLELKGRVVDSAGRGLSGAQARWDFRPEGLGRFPYVVTGSSQRHGLSFCDEQGNFEFVSVPAGTSGFVRFSAPGFTTEALSIPEHSQHDLEIVLEAESTEAQVRLSGRVVHADGRPAAGAQVDFGQDGCRADADGRFELRLTTGARPETSLTAFATGARPGTLARFGERILAEGTSVEGVVLVLGEALPAIRARVLDEDGRPCAGWSAALLDAEPWGTSNRSLESMAADEPLQVRTDAEGRVAFGGLLEHPYRVRAWSQETLVALESGPVQPGGEVELRVPASPLVDLVVGRVVSRRGIPVGNASIVLGLVTAELGGGRSMVFKPAGEADAAGRFEIRNVPRHGCLIGAQAASIRGGSVPFDETMLGRELVIEVDLELRFRVEPRSAGEFDRFGVQDRAGAPVIVVMQLHASRSSTDRVGRRSDGFPVCSTTEVAETLVLYQGETEVRRVPLVLRPGEITIVAP
jgi:RNA polymerase sigma factor (sigma-70 family)